MNVGELFIRTGPETKPTPNTGDEAELRHQVFRNGVQIAACLSGAIALLVLGGWILDIDILRRFIPGQPAMKANTAVALLLASIALGLSQRRGWAGRLSDCSSLAALLLGALSAAQYLIAVHTGLDELFISDTTNEGSPYPGRMALATALICVMTGAALLLASRLRWIFASQWLAGGVATLCLLTGVGYLYGVHNVLNAQGHTPVAIATCIGFGVMAAGILALRPGFGLMGHITRQGSGSIMARQILPVIFLAPVLVGWLRNRGEQLGLFDNSLGVTLSDSALILLFTFSVWRSAGLLNQSESARANAETRMWQSEVRYRELLEQSPAAIWVLDIKGRPKAVNPAFQRMFCESGDRDVQFATLITHIDPLLTLAAQGKVASAPPAPFGDPTRWIDVTVYPVKDPAGRPEELVVFCRDVSDRETANAAVRESEAQLRQMTEAMPQIVWTADAFGHIDYLNAQAAPFVEGTGTEAHIVLHPDDEQDVNRWKHASLSTGAPFQSEQRLRVAADGSFRWHLGRAVSIRNAAGETVRWFGTYTDIEHIKQAEARITDLNQQLEKRVGERTRELRESEERYRMLVDNVKDYAIIMLDPEGKVSSWSSSASRINGYQAGEILGRSFECFYPKENIDKGHPQRVLEITRFAGHYEEEGWRVRKDGSAFWANVTLTAVYDETGAVQGFSKITRDISERRKIENRLQESESQFRHLLDCAPDAIVVVNDSSELVLVNAQAEKLFGYDRQELLGKCVEVLIPAEACGSHSQERLNLQKHARVRSMSRGMERKGIRKSGEEFPGEVSLSPVKITLGNCVAVGIRDISERKHAEQRLIEERRRAEEANKTKSAFLAAMSHEIRTPMNSLLGMADLLWESELNAEQRHYVEVFRRAGSNLLTLIDAILNFSKIESGRIELERVEFDLQEVVDQAVELVAPKARTKRLALLSRFLPETATSLIGDPTRICQVLVNLLGNAVKFTAEGEVLLTVGNAVNGAPGEISFAVADTGIGIPADKLGSVFCDFTQADSSITREYGGSGLGLAISRRLVNLMGGELSVQSVVGKGSTFSFTGQFEIAAERACLPAPFLDDIHGRRVLVIDNNPVNCLILRETLRSWGLQSTEFERPDDALRHLELGSGDQGYSLIVVDKYLPGTDGFAVAERIRAMVPNVPRIMLSSDATPGDLTRSAKAGFAGYGTKPVKRADLLRLVCNAIRGHSSREPLDATHLVTQPATPAVNALRILVAEDSEDNRLLVEAYLKGSAHSIAFVEDGLAAVEAFSHEHFDLVLMDLQMPRMDGLTATRRIREIEAGQQLVPTPILALSANARPEDVEMSRAVGCDSHLSKPISKSKLLNSIGQYAPKTKREVPTSSERTDGMQAMSAQYLLRRKAEVSKLFELMQVPDFDQIRRAGHNMKGTGVSYGFPKLTQLGAAIEIAAKTCDCDCIGRQLHELAAYIADLDAAPPADNRKPVQSDRLRT